MTLREAITAVRADGRQRNARCPAHEDRRESLSVGLGEDARILLNCHTGCRFEDIITAAGLSRDELAPATRRNGGGARSETTLFYDYRDEGGVLLFQKERRPGKKFLLRRPDGAGGWTYRLDGTRRIVYRLRDLQGQETVIIAEGEKDVDRLWALDLPATTNPEGAAKAKDRPKWRDDYAQQLAAAGVRHVYVLPDNDEPGRAHAAAVATSCQRAGLAARVIDLPGVPPKGDVSDWLDAGHTAAELSALFAGAPLRPGTTTRRTTTQPRTLADVEATFARWIRDADHPDARRARGLRRQPDARR